jgi:hypothetical protein
MWRKCVPSLYSSIHTMGMRASYFRRRTTCPPPQASMVLLNPSSVVEQHGHRANHRSPYLVHPSILSISLPSLSPSLVQYSSASGTSFVTGCPHDLIKPTGRFRIRCTGIQQLGENALDRITPTVDVPLFQRRGPDVAATNLGFLLMNPTFQPCDL